jgi:hypothetical protein
MINGFGKRPVRKFVLPLLVVLLFWGGCENPLVQDILRGPATMENISVGADGLGMYSLTPMFSAGITEYTVTVPYATRSISVGGRPGRDGEVSYSRGGEESASGVFAFGEEDYGEATVILVRVERPYMDPQVYTVTVIRGSDSLLRNLELRAGQTAQSIGGSPRPLSPGFTPGIQTEYAAGVPSATEVLSIKGSLKPGASISREQFEADGVTAIAHSSPDPEIFDFPLGLDCTKIKITVSLEDGAEIYWLTVSRPGKVKAPLDLFDIVGGQDDPTAPPGYGVRYFDHGEPVVLRAVLSFGRKMSGVERAEADGLGSPVSGTEEPLTSETGLYAFAMPAHNVIVTGTSVSIEPVPGGAVLYVRGLTDAEIAALEADPSAVPSGDGSSWENASLDLQDVMDNKWSSGKEIWVSAGKVRPELPQAQPGWVTGFPTTNYPDYGAYRGDPRNRAFVLKEGVKIYGGFQGTETAPTAEAGRALRDPARCETVLSGDLGGLGRAKHVVIAAGVSIATRLDGLTISGGNAFMDAYDSALRINGRLLTPTSGMIGSGGGLCVLYAGPRLHNVIIRDNTARMGGGIFNWSSNPVLTGVGISNCIATHDNVGGGIYNNSGSTPLILGGSISGNSGAAVYSQDYSHPILINASLGRNTTGIHALYATSFTLLINVSVSGNDRGIVSDSSISLSKTVFNSVVGGSLYNDIEGFFPGSSPLNSEVGGQVYNQESAENYQPVVNGVLNTNPHYSSGGDLYEVYIRLNGLPSDVKTEILPLLEGLPTRGAQ